MPEAMFTIEINDTVTLTTSEVWPDGDAPERPTAADVAEVMKSDFGIFGAVATLTEWNVLSDHPTVHIYGPGTFAVASEPTIEAVS